MRAIFLCEKSDMIFSVFDNDTLNELATLLAVEKRVYKKADVLENSEQFKDVEYVFSTWGMPQFSSEEIKRCFPSLKCVFYGAGTVQSFAREFLECNVKVFSAWAANAVPVAEMTVAQIILANKGYFLTSRIYHKKGRGEARRAFADCRGNYGQCVGIIGAGMIGKLVINMLRQYNLKVIVFDPFLSDDAANKLGVQKCSLEEVFEKAFVVSNHLANNEQTKGMLNYDLFAKMQKNAVFINTGRGAQVIEADLVKILEQRSDLTALLDVTFPEPPVADHPFYTLENCILTPHIAGSAGDEVARMGLYMLGECKAYLDGEKCLYEVTPKMLETMA